MGKLIYLTLTRLDIMNAIKVVSQFIYAPTNIHMHIIEKNLYYLKKNPAKGILFATSEEINIEGYFDAILTSSIGEDTSLLQIFLVSFNKSKAYFFLFITRPIFDIANLIYKKYLSFPRSLRSHLLLMITISSK